MLLLELPAAYFIWHYTTALQQLYTVWTNFVWYVIHLFSIPLLLRTLFSPWKRIVEPLRRQDLEEIFATIVFNIISRIVGFCIRIPIIALGCVTVAGMAVGLVFLYIVWLTLPVILLLLFSLGISYVYV